MKRITANGVFLGIFLFLSLVFPKLVFAETCEECIDNNLDNPSICFAQGGPCTTPGSPFYRCPYLDWTNVGVDYCANNFEPPSNTCTGSTGQDSKCGYLGPWQYCYASNCQVKAYLEERPFRCKYQYQYIYEDCDAKDSCTGAEPFLKAGRCGTGTPCPGDSNTHCTLGGTYKTCCERIGNSFTGRVGGNCVGGCRNGACPEGSAPVICGVTSCENIGGTCTTAACGEPACQAVANFVPTPGPSPTPAPNPTSPPSSNEYCSLGSIECCDSWVEVDVPAVAYIGDKVTVHVFYHNGWGRGDCNYSYIPGDDQDAIDHHLKARGRQGEATGDIITWDQIGNFNGAGSKTDIEYRILRKDEKGEYYTVYYKRGPLENKSQRTFTFEPVSWDTPVGNNKTIEHNWENGRVEEVAFDWDTSNLKPGKYEFYDIYYGGHGDNCPWAPCCDKGHGGLGCHGENGYTCNLWLPKVFEEKGWGKRSPNHWITILKPSPSPTPLPTPTPSPTPIPPPTPTPTPAEVCKDAEIPTISVIKNQTYENKLTFHWNSNNSCSQISWSINDGFITVVSGEKDFSSGSGQQEIGVEEDGEYHISFSARGKNTANNYSCSDCETNNPPNCCVSNWASKNDCTLCRHPINIQHGPAPEGVCPNGGTKITWNDVSQLEDGFVIYRCPPGSVEEGSCPSTTDNYFATVGKNTTSFIDCSAPDGTYDYAVRCYTETCGSIDKITPTPVPTLPNTYLSCVNCTCVTQQGIAPPGYDNCRALGLSAGSSCCFGCSPPGAKNFTISPNPPYPGSSVYLSVEGDTSRSVSSLKYRFYAAEVGGGGGEAISWSCVYSDWIQTGGTLSGSKWTPLVRFKAPETFILDQIEMPFVVESGSEQFVSIILTDKNGNRLTDNDGGGRRCTPGGQEVLVDNSLAQKVDDEGKISRYDLANTRWATFSFGVRPLLQKGQEYRIWARLRAGHTGVKSVWCYDTYNSNVFSRTAFRLYKRTVKYQTIGSFGSVVGNGTHLGEVIWIPYAQAQPGTEYLLVAEVSDSLADNNDVLGDGDDGEAIESGVQTKVVTLASPPLGTITGIVWDDKNANLICNNEQGKGGITVFWEDGQGNREETTTIDTSSCSINNYNFTNVPAKRWITVCVDTDSLPSGYRLSTSRCLTGYLDDGDTLTFNFGVTNKTNPWFQIEGGGAYLHESFSVSIPSGQYFIRESEEGEVGSVITASDSLSWGEGELSSRNWQVKNSPVKGFEKWGIEKFSRRLADSKILITTDKSALSQITDLSCGENTCSLGTSKVIVEVTSSLFTIDRNVTVEKGGFFALLSQGEVNVNSEVTRLDGFYLSEKNFEIEEGNQQLIVNGALAITKGANLYLNRDLNEDNQTSPAVTFHYRPDLLLNSPRELWKAKHKIRELLP